MGATSGRRRPHTTPAFGALLRSARERSGLSQDAVAEQAGVGRQVIIRWEQGQAATPRPDYVRAVCRVLDVDPIAAAIALGYIHADDLAAVA